LTNYSLITKEETGEYIVSSETTEVYATLEGDGRLLIRSWYDAPPHLNLPSAVNFLIRNTSLEIDVIQGIPGFWQTLGFTSTEEKDRWRYLR
jgi:hypothetical protein